MKKSLLFACLVCILPLLADKAPIRSLLKGHPQPDVESPWFTGPLIAASGLTVPAGHYNIEPYLYMIAQTGRYDSNWHANSIQTFLSNSFQPSIQFGLTSWMDFEFAPALFYNHTSGSSKWGVGDMPVLFDFQLYKHGDEITDWLTGVKLTVQELIPMGKYRNLNPNKQGTDAIGGGSWQTSFGLVWGNMFYLGGDRFLTARLNLRYVLPAPVHVKNLNTYGGAQGTNGTVYPSQSFQCDIGTELTLSRHWAFAMDILGVWNGKTRFKGNATATNTAPASAQFSLAPAIEYNWNGNLGIIFGPWFTIAGRNSTQFAGGVFALNYYK